MPNERVRTLAERMREKSLREHQDQEGRLLRVRTLASKAPQFWKDFVVQVTTVFDQFKEELNSPAQWSDLSVSGSGIPDWKLEISKYRTSPYLHAVLTLDSANACIRGAYKSAATRPTASTWPLNERTILIELRIDAAGRVYGVIDGRPYPTLEDLATAILELVMAEPANENRAAAAQA